MEFADVGGCKEIERERERERGALSSHLSLLSEISPLRIISLLLLSSWNEGNAILVGVSWPARGRPRARTQWQIILDWMSLSLPLCLLYWSGGLGSLEDRLIAGEYLQFPTPWWWWCHLRPCRTGKMLPWTQRFALLSVDRPISSKDIRAGLVALGGWEGLGGWDVNVRQSHSLPLHC